MKTLTHFTLSRLALVPLLGALVIGLIWPLGGAAQDKHAGQSADADKSLSAQLRELKAKVATLEAALEKRYPGAVSKDVPADKGMGMMGGKGKGMMGSADDDDITEMMKTMRTMMQMKMMQMKNKNMMDAMPGKGMGMMGMDMMGGKGMDMMGSMMKGMSGMQTPSALPGFPGASHIYHLGATGFFLDHPEHIQLTTKQQADLNSIKEKALLEQATTQRKIDEADQELWRLTASDQPEAKKIEAKVREIELLRGDQRLAFIRSVGEAAKALTEEQRQALLGHAKPQEHKHTPAPTK